MISAQVPQEMLGTVFTLLCILWKDSMDSIHIQFPALNEHLVRTEGCSDCGWEITRGHGLCSWRVKVCAVGERVLQSFPE